MIRQFRNDWVPLEARLPLAAQVIVEMFRHVPSPFKRQAFISAVLNQFGSRGLAAGLLRGLEVLFGVDVAAFLEAASMVRVWTDGPLQR